MVGRLNPNWIVPTAPRGTSDNRAASTAFVTGGSSGAGPRIVLASATNFYYKPSTGSDTNPGTSTSPWASAAPLFSLYDFGNQAVTLNLQENTTVSTSINSWVGGGSLTLDLGSHTVTTTNNPCIAVGPGALPGTVTIQNTGALSATGTGTISGIQHKGGGKLLLSNVNFGACTFAGLWLSGSGGGSPEASFIGNATLSGNSQYLFFLAAFCTIVLNADSSNQPTTLTTTAARTYSGAVLQAVISFADLTGAVWNTSAGAITGTRIINPSNLSFIGGSIP